MNHQNQSSPTVSPLMKHLYEAPSIFRPEELVEAVKATRNIEKIDVPKLCVLEFDGDLTDKLHHRGELKLCETWPCFHTSLWSWQRDEICCGLIPRTIGGPYTVLVAEQLAVCGAKAIIGLASAGRINPSLSLPGIVIAERAIRDEGVSHHYLPPEETVEATSSLTSFLEHSVGKLEQPVQRGLVWTTDAPYRETQEEIAHYAAQGVLAVEMQAASLFAFGVRKNFPVALIAHVTNAVDYTGEQFEKGPDDFDIRLLESICEGAKQWLASTEEACFFNLENK